MVAAAFSADPGYASLIQKLWCDFVVYLGEPGEAGQFDRNTYEAELYVLTLAKLLCANVIVSRALASDDDELYKILDGRFFRARGLTNLVEYDYFGWLNDPPHVSALLPVARGMQDDLRAYDFVSAPAEDVFGALLAQLARRSKRILLGQEWTPSWLASKIVEQVISRLPSDTDPRLVDMCCGSGAMVVTAVRQSMVRICPPGAVPDQDSLRRLAQAMTGFDIDLLAVMLAKVAWVLAAREWFSVGAGDISIPIFHADSLFAVTPLSKTVIEDTGTTIHELHLDDHKVALPAFLVSPRRRMLFDSLLDRSYAVAMARAKAPPADFPESTIEMIIDQVSVQTGDDLSVTEKTSTIGFCRGLLSSLEALQRTGRNGIWAFVLRNSYRPELVAGQFNGLASNPPWLALSKVADNPYKEALTVRLDIPFRRAADKLAAAATDRSTAEGGHAWRWASANGCRSRCSLRPTTCRVPTATHFTRG